MQIRPYGPGDWPALWALLEPVFRAGETFPHDPAISEAEAQVAWVEQSQAVMVASELALRSQPLTGFQVVMPGKYTTICTTTLPGLWGMGWDLKGRRSGSILPRLLIALQG